MSNIENSYEWKMEQIPSSILVFFLEFLAWMFLFFSHWPSYSNCWNQIVISVYLLCRLRKSSIREASIERKAKAQEEVLQQKVKQLEDQLQGATQKHNKEQSDSEARRLKVRPFVALLWWHAQSNCLVLYYCSRTCCKWCTLTIHAVKCWIKVVHTHSLAGEMLH